ENPDKNFLPAPGRIEAFFQPDGARVDTGVRSGDEISPFYDPMIAKIIVKGADRAEAISRLNAALAETAVFGLTNNLPLLRGIARHPEFAKGSVDTGFIERELKTLLTRPKLKPAALAAATADELSRLPGDGPWAADGWRLGGERGVGFKVHSHEDTGREIRITGNAHAFTLSMDGADYGYQAEHTGPGAGWSVSSSDGTDRAEVLRHGQEFQVALDGEAHSFSLMRRHAPKAGRVTDAATHPLSPMPGRVVAVHVKAGDRVEPGQALMVLEGMKMEYTVKAAVAGVIEKVMFETGAMVDAEAALAHIKASE
ncbi:MAG TPA: biotin/lipoyl-containing protein, partial [Gammaproteobacteria bacterium]|nr:biotin/lipoyl-containing protein [Gammaproteobacteria bacterium]